MCLVAVSEFVGSGAQRGADVEQPALQWRVPGRSHHASGDTSRLDPTPRPLP